MTPSRWGVFTRLKFSHLECEPSKSKLVVLSTLYSLIVMPVALKEKTLKGVRLTNFQILEILNSL